MDGPTSGSIPALPETVWQLHTDINHWAGWRSDVSSATLEGLLKPGSVFIWKTPGVTITSTLQEVETNRRISWTGIGLGTTAAHIWALEARDDGTLVVTEESMSGWVPRVMKFFMPGFLDKSLDVWLGDMKKRLRQANLYWPHRAVENTASLGKRRSRHDAR